MEMQYPAIGKTGPFRLPPHLSVSDPTLTVTNLGDRGVETAFPIIIPPQVAMVGFGRILDEVVASEGEAVVHPVVHATLADIAPEVDRNEVDDDLDLTEQLDLDSMDYLTWMIAISEEAGLDIPQRDVSKFLTVDGAVSYLVANT